MQDRPAHRSLPDPATGMEHVALRAEACQLASTAALTIGMLLADITQQYAQTRPWLVLEQGAQTGVSSIMPRKRNRSGLVWLRERTSTVASGATVFAFQVIMSHPGCTTTNRKVLTRFDGSSRVQCRVLHLGGLRQCHMRSHSRRGAVPTVYWSTPGRPSNEHTRFALPPTMWCRSTNDKYHRTKFMKVSYMNKKARAKRDLRRGIIRHSLKEIAEELGARLREADLRQPVYLVVPSGGDALVSMMTPLDPSDEHWRRTGVIVRDILSNRLEGITLRSAEMPCTVANEPMGAAEITGD